MLKMGRSFLGIVSGVAFLTAALAHGYRAYAQFPMTYGDWLVPIWVSWLVALVAFLLALVSFKNLR